MSEVITYAINVQDTVVLFAEGKTEDEAIKNCYDKKFADQFDLDIFKQIITVELVGVKNPKVWGKENSLHVQGDENG
jgi:hypothetical protein